MIIYFTGTGNSKYIANIMAQRLDDTAISAAELIKAGKNPSFDSQKPYIFVTPIYAWRIPRVFQNWIQKCEYSGNKKAYFVITCGDSIGTAQNYVKKFAEKRGFCYMGTAELVMPENYIVMFKAPEPQEDEGIISKAENKTAELCQKIQGEQPFDNIKNTFVGHLCSDLVNPMFYTFYIGAKKFYSTDKCISCGKCAEICMLNNIIIKDGRPVWGKDCTHCMACISRCPTEAIEYGKHTIGLRRYVCPKDKNEE